MAKIEYDATGLDRVILSAKTHMNNLASMEERIAQAAGLVYAATEQWFDSDGEGSWPPLASSTVSKKVSQGRDAPQRPLYAEGNLRHSAISPTGPYSYFIPMHDGVVIGIVWTAAKALAAGTMSSGSGRSTRIPARPIFPPPWSALGLTMTKAIGDIVLRGHTTAMHPTFVPTMTRHLPSMVTHQEMRRPAGGWHGHPISMTGSTPRWRPGTGVKPI